MFKYSNILTVSILQTKIILNDGQVKSFVHDLNMEQGIVSMRVGYVLRSAEIKPLVPLICFDDFFI